MKKLLFSAAIVLAAIATKAQDSTKTVENPLIITGSVDAYYKYDFSKFRSAAGTSNIPTSFATDQNSFSIGMIDLGVKKKVNKASFVGELSFGPRGEIQSIPNGGSNNQSFHIQNLYVGYDLTDKLNVTAGYMATFLGYEVVSPVGNFNYSTSYLFTNGPFQNAGVKLTYAFSSKVSLMAGIFNDYWNVYQSGGKINTFGSQLMVSPAKGWVAYVNLLTGPQSGTIVDLTTTYQITDAFKLGLNGATFSAPDAVKGGFEGVALYPQIAVSKDVTLGLRGEYFKTKNGGFTTAGPPAGESITAFTLTANVKAGPLTFIPEVRLDNGSTAQFINKSAGPTKQASQFLLAAVYAF
ncbi:porin [Mucilaginibacter glaciei]|uniref:Porin n=1 Tax=Mucilaginibacter glaciei TaxID=2772109 RepID=A0A926S1D3_9SPHI|nr:porin [Mucilaginibacter glaciei]MBD1392034.1 porin [Mucilaginibacter glaciei]